MRKKTDKKTVKSNIFLSFLFFLVLAFSLSCDKAEEALSPHSKPHYEKSTSATDTPKLIYGGDFQMRNGGLYQRLLTNCKRCMTGKRRVDINTGTYEHNIFSFGHNPNKCDNWIGPGSLEIIFEEDRLPTSVTVTIWPQYNRGSRKFWEPRQAFSVKGEAKAINESDGFEAKVLPSGGLGGSYVLSIKSSNANHVKNTKLEVVVSYGAGASSGQMISATLSKLVKKAILPLKFPVVNTHFKIKVKIL